MPRNCLPECDVGMARIATNPHPLEVWDDRARWPMPLEIRTDAGGPTGMLAEEQRHFGRVVHGLDRVHPGATDHDALQVQAWLDRLDRAARACPPSDASST